MATSLLVLDDAFGTGWAATLAQVATVMREPLIFGIGTQTTNQLNGLAYSIGFSTWSELGTTLGFANTQPAKKQFVEIEKAGFLPPKTSEVLAVVNATLAAMEKSFGLILAQVQATSGFEITPENQIRRDEIVDVANITMQRSIQVLNLILLAETKHVNMTSPEWLAAEDALTCAAEIVARREKHFNVARIASWRPNPTAYSYTYLWTAHSQYFWWRDRMQVFRNATGLSPCLMNIQNPLQVAFGEGVWNGIAALLRKLLDKFGAQVFGECLSSPTSEPEYPRDAH